MLRSPSSGSSGGVLPTSGPYPSAEHEGLERYRERVPEPAPVVSHRRARGPVTRVPVRAIDGDAVLERPDTLVTEEPMEIRVHGPGQIPVPLTVTMRTPGNDFELAAGLCFAEGIIDGPDDLASVAYCLAGEAPQEYNVVTVALRRPFDPQGHERRFAATASCGLCGKVTIDQLAETCVPIPDGPSVASSMLASLPAQLRAAQTVFASTGGLHAAAVFDLDGHLVALREDVGRHNALDKVIGRALLQHELPLRDHVVVVSGRVGYELVQKASRAQIPILCAISAPSSLAVEAAGRCGLTIVGFLRDVRANVYTHPQRVVTPRA